MQIDYHFTFTERDLNKGGCPRKVEETSSGLNYLDAYTRLCQSLRKKKKDLHVVLDVKATRKMISGRVVDVEVQ